MTSRPIFRDRETRVNDAQLDKLVRTTVKDYSVGQSVEALLAQLVGKTHLSNLIAIAGNDMFTMEQRQAAVDIINNSVFEPNVIKAGRR